MDGSDLLTLNVNFHEVHPGARVDHQPRQGSVEKQRGPALR